MLAVLAVVAVLVVRDRWWWVGELAVSFLPQIALALGVVAAVLGALGRLRLALLLAGAALLGLSGVVPLWLDEPAPPLADSPVLRVLAHNVHGDGRERFDDVVAEIDTSDADVVLLTQVPPDWIERLPTTDLPYDFILLSEGDDGLQHLALHRIPVERRETFDMGDRAPASAAALDVALGEEDVTLLSLQTRSPRRPQRAETRNRQLEAATTWVGAQDTPVVVIGDLNVTPWSPAFRRLTAAGLRDSQRGFGLQPSWPSSGGPLMVPIDHALHTAELTIVDRGTGPAHGSEHRSVVVDLTWAAPSGSR